MITTEEEYRPYRHCHVKSQHLTIQEPISIDLGMKNNSIMVDKSTEQIKLLLSPMTGKSSQRNFQGLESIRSKTPKIDF